MTDMKTMLPLRAVGAAVPDAAPARFHERFAATGEIHRDGWPRITTDASRAAFPPRAAGLRVLFINPPIREWSYPNIMPIGQGYVGAVAAMDGHQVEVLDLNAARREPVKDSPAVFAAWIEQQVLAALDRHQPQVIGIGGIITQYRTDPGDRPPLPPGAPRRPDRPRRRHRVVGAGVHGAAAAD